MKSIEDIIRFVENKIDLKIDLADRNIQLSLLKDLLQLILDEEYKKFQIEARKEEWDKFEQFEEVGDAINFAKIKPRKLFGRNSQLCLIVEEIILVEEAINIVEEARNMPQDGVLSNEMIELEEVFCRG